MDKQDKFITGPLSNMNSIKSVPPNLTLSELYDMKKKLIKQWEKEENKWQFIVDHPAMLDIFKNSTASTIFLKYPDLLFPNGTLGASAGAVVMISSSVNVRNSGFIMSFQIQNPNNCQIIVGVCDTPGLNTASPPSFNMFGVRLTNTNNSTFQYGLYGNGTTFGTSSAENNTEIYSIGWHSSNTLYGNRQNNDGNTWITLGQSLSWGGPVFVFFYCTNYGGPVTFNMVATPAALPAI